MNWKVSRKGIEKYPSRPEQKHSPTITLTPEFRTVEIQGTPVREKRWRVRFSGQTYAVDYKHEAEEIAWKIQNNINEGPPRGSHLQEEEE